MIQSIQRFLERLGVEIRRTGYQPWQQDPAFTPIFEEIRRLTLLSRDRCFMLYQLARQSACLNGAMAEVGVYKGGSARLIATAAPTRLVHLFDTFGGMPLTDPTFDRHKAGDFSDTSLAAVKRTLFKTPNVRFHAGVFPNTASAVENETFSFVHVDCDLYGAVSSCLSFFFPRLVAGGLLIFDDYGWTGCPGVFRAITEFRERTGHALLVTARYQCAIMKMPSGQENQQAPPEDDAPSKPVSRKLETGVQRLSA